VRTLLHLTEQQFCKAANTAVVALQAGLQLVAIRCPSCDRVHLDEGPWAVHAHHTHRCACGVEWDSGLPSGVGTILAVCRPRLIEGHPHRLQFTMPCEAWESLLPFWAGAPLSGSSQDPPASGSAGATQGAGPTAEGAAPSSQPPTSAPSPAATATLATPPRVAVVRPGALPEGLSDWMPLPSGPPTPLSARPATLEPTVSLGQVADTLA
jgi:hypothetical protein